MIRRHMLPEIARPTLTYGLSDDADVQVLDFGETSNRSRFRAPCRAGELGDPESAGHPQRPQRRRRHRGGN